MKDIYITKNKFKKAETHPDYKMSIKTDDGFEEVGACWLKDDKAGGKYFSCKLSDNYIDYTKNITKRGFSLVADEQIKIDKTIGEADPF